MVMEVIQGNDEEKRTALLNTAEEYKRTGDYVKYEEQLISLLYSVCLLIYHVLSNSLQKKWNTKQTSRGYIYRLALLSVSNNLQR